VAYARDALVALDAVALFRDVDQQAVRVFGPRFGEGIARRPRFDGPRRIECGQPRLGLLEALDDKTDVVQAELLGVLAVLRALLEQPHVDGAVGHVDGAVWQPVELLEAEPAVVVVLQFLRVSADDGHIADVRHAFPPQLTWRHSTVALLRLAQHPLRDRHCRLSGCGAGGRAHSRGLGLPSG